MTERYRTIAEKFNHFKDKKDITGTKKLICEALSFIEDKNLTSEERVSLYYSIATAYSDIPHFMGDNIEMIEINGLNAKALYFFSMAIAGLENLKPFTNDLFQRIYTNSAVKYADTGRLIKAIQMLNKTSFGENLFPMAMAHAGAFLMDFACLYYEKEQCDILIAVGYENLCIALSCPEALAREGALDAFLEYKSSLESSFPPSILNKQISIDSFSLFNKKTEIDYRNWTTIMGLNLNVLNDVMMNELSAFDNVHLPNMRYLNGENKFSLHFGMFNQIIQEYVSARYLFYDGQRSRKSTRLADRNVYQIDMYEIVNSHSDFCIRTAFRTIYSLFDKIAFFINEYWNVDIPVDRISFSRIWKSGKTKIEVALKTNFMIRALFWVSQELYEPNGLDTNPESKRIYQIRNFMEHRYLAATLHEEYIDTKYLKHITTIELYNKTLDLFHLCREAIIYLAIAINIEEARKRKEDNEKE